MDRHDPATQHESEASVHRIHNATVRLIDRTDLKEGGTAVLIRAREHLVLATAAHVAVEGHVLEIAPRPGQKVVMPEFVGDDQVNDVAVLRINEPSDLLERAIPLADLKTDIDLNRSQEVIVTGYPGEYLNVVSQIPIGDAGVVDIRGSSALTYASITIPISDWPSEWFGETPSSTRDLFVNYEPSDITRMLKRENVNWIPPAKVGDKPPALGGVSGAGIWMEQISGDVVLHPRPLLLGIQVAVGSKYKMLRGVQIHNWLRLLNSCLPASD